MEKILSKQQKISTFGKQVNSNIEFYLSFAQDEQLIENLKSLHSTFAFISDQLAFKIQEISSKSQLFQNVNLNALAQFQKMVLRHYKEEIKGKYNYLVNKQEELNQNDYADDILIVKSKLICIAEIIQQIFKVEKDDIMFMDRNSQQWQLMNKRIEYKQFYPADEVYQKYLKWTHCCSFGVVYTQLQTKFSNKILSFLASGIGSLYYMFNIEKAIKAHQLAVAKNDTKQIIELTRMGQHWTQEYLVKFSSWKIEVNQKIYVPKENFGSFIHSEDKNNLVQSNTETVE